jgi:hypothetical protein
MTKQTNNTIAAANEPTDTGRATSGAKVRAHKRFRGPRRTAPPSHAQIFQPLPPWLWFVALALAGWGLFTPNPILTPCAILMLPVLASLLWVQGEPPVLLFACAMQWLQASVAVFHRDFYGLPLNAMYEEAELNKAIWLSLIGVLVQAVGMRLALVWRKTGIAGQVEQETRLLQPATIFVWYLVAFVVFSFVGRVAWSMPSLAQPILATMTVKWVLVFLLAYSVLAQRRHFTLLWLAVCLEFFTGLLGYFASFKNVFFVLLVVLPTASFIFKGWRLVQFCAVAALLLAFGLVWTVIKSDYREFLNRGSGQQEVLVTVPERIEKLSQLLGGLDRRAFDDGLETMAMRVSYVSIFAMTISHVPETVPYENGALWWGAIKHVLTPRLFFPNKAALDDSTGTEKYTGYQVAGAEQGTSIGIGYMGESYIDFGPVGMFAPILLLGLFYGIIYRFFVDRQRYRMFGFAMATAILALGAYTIETSNIKLLGGNLMSLIVIGLFSKFTGERFWRGLTHQNVPFQRRRRGRTKPKERTEPVES